MLNLEFSCLVCFRHTRDAVRQRVRAKAQKKTSKGNFGSNKNAERIRAKQMAKFDC